MGSGEISLWHSRLVGETKSCRERTREEDEFHERLPLSHMGTNKLGTNRGNHLIFLSRLMISEKVK